VERRYDPVPSEFERLALYTVLAAALIAVPSLGSRDRPPVVAAQT